MKVGGEFHRDTGPCSCVGCLEDRETARQESHRPRLLDLFCGAGGCSVGYHRAGFDVVGVDLHPQPNYPFEFMQADCRKVMQDFRWIADEFDAVHASPPCQAHSDLQRQSKIEYDDLVPSAQCWLNATGLPYVIENVEGAPLVDPVVLCGTMFPGLRVIRHRLFEANWPLTAPLHGKHPLVFTHDKRKAHYGKLDQDTAFVQVTGGGNASVANKLDAMGIDWMTGREVNQAIPPAYTEWIGGQLIEQLSDVAVAA